MLIGVSGKIGSGKDLVGKIIQYHLYMDKEVRGRYYPPEVFIDELDTVDLNEVTNSEIKKYADKLKDISCLLIGCTREQLEDRIFKETELGPEWWYYKGEAGIYPYNTPYEANKKLPLIKPTPRMVLQEIGTDLFRNQLHPNVWINATMAEYQPIAGTMDVRRSKEIFPNWIITDVRFPNEADAIKERKGLLLRVERPCKECGLLRVHKMSCSKNLNEHISETALDDYNFDYTISNIGNIEELIEKIKKILILEGIING